MKIPKIISEYYVPTLGLLADLAQSTARVGVVWKEQDVFKRIVTKRRDMAPCASGIASFSKGFFALWGIGK